MGVINSKPEDLMNLIRNNELTSANIKPYLPYINYKDQVQRIKEFIKAPFTLKKIVVIFIIIIVDTCI